LAYFHEHEIRKPRQYLAEIYFTGTHENAIADVLDRKADIGAAKNTVFERMAAKDPRIKKDLQILATSPEVPENALALRGNLEETTRRKILDALLGMDQDPEGREVLKKFGARRFVPTTDKDYDTVIQYAREIHIDLATYDYLND
jgi:phosphonate transport system substrate-binding protein